MPGNVIGLLDSTGTQVVKYTYDAWGKPTGKSGTMKNTLGTVQPFRYRGYVYDEETGLYYLRSRFYCSDRCRFLNADTILHGDGMPITSQLFSYCDNSPVIAVDEDGQVWIMGVYATYYGYFHAKTQALVAACNPGMEVEVSLRYKGWRADLIYNGAIYEVKPKRASHITIGLAQIARYASAPNTTYVPGAAPLVLPEPITWITGNQMITMNFEQRGSLVLYSFQIKKTPKQDQTMPAPIALPAESPDEVRHRAKMNSAGSYVPLAIAAVGFGCGVCLMCCVSESPMSHMAN